MVDVMGHAAMGLLWAIPAWFLWNGRVSVGFIGLAVAAALFPDVDVYLSAWFPGQFHHHGVTHTVVFVAAVSLVVAAIVAGTMAGPADRWLRNERFDAGSLFVFVASATFLGGLSHVFADILSAPDISTPIEPFWPFYGGSLSIDLIWYNDPMWNIVFLSVVLLLHGVIAYSVEPASHRYRLEGA